MEHNESYRGVVATIRALESQLALCDTNSRSLDNEGEDIEQLVEEHFAKLAAALDARKTAVVHECNTMINIYKKTNAQNRTKLSESITKCKKALMTGAMLYETDKAAGIDLWKKAYSTMYPQVSAAHVSIDLPDSLLQNIHMHGSVTLKSTSPKVARTSKNNFTKPDVVTTFAGLQKGLEDGKGLEAKFSYPRGVCLNPNDNCLYVCDSFNHAIRKVSMKGEVSTFVTNGEELSHPHGIAMSYQDNSFFVTNTKTNKIVKINSLGIASTFAGTGHRGYKEGPGAKARFNYPSDLVIDQETGIIYVSDYGNHVIRKITPKGDVSTLAGSGEKAFADGKGKSAKFHHPWGMVLDPSDKSLIVCDEFNNALRRVTLNGEVSTICELWRPAFVGITPNRTLLVSSQQNKIYKVTQAGGEYDVECIVGAGGRVMDANANEVRLCQPNGIAVHEPSHTCFVAEYAIHTIKQISFVN
eukprot:Phypoly_transcript_04720.p1 GENE.Phypoly_transcript_04720~~Phypoly_transcript_04720.p1  ORF type:complete len:470 (+),score=59.82 Phypoly_transcript_04720:85-1494(+)